MEKLTRREFLSLIMKGFLALVLASTSSWQKVLAKTTRLLEERFCIKEKPFRRNDLYQKHSLAG